MFYPGDNVRIANTLRCGRFLSLAVLAFGGLGLTACSGSPSSASSKHHANGIATAPTGSYTGYLRQLDLRTRKIEFDRVLWYTGNAAKKACRKDKVKIPPEGEWCHDYYIHDTKKLLGARVAQKATIRSQLSFNQRGISAAGFPLSLRQVLSLMEQTATADQVYRMSVRQGVITRIFGLYHP